MTEAINSASFEVFPAVVSAGGHAVGNYSPYVFLPRNHTAPAKRCEGAGAAAEGCRGLLVEDDPLIARDLRLTLEAAGATVVAGGARGTGSS